jgi:hypothetical protein
VTISHPDQSPTISSHRWGTPILVFSLMLTAVTTVVSAVLVRAWSDVGLWSEAMLWSVLVTCAVEYRDVGSRVLIIQAPAECEANSGAPT